jgi:hypothetical protein
MSRAIASVSETLHTFPAARARQRSSSAFRNATSNSALWMRKLGTVHEVEEFVGDLREARLVGEDPPP